MSDLQVYEKLALKYRPKTLDEVFGQDAVTTQLKGMFRKRRISNVYLLSGATGCGKTTIGRIIFQYANCHDFDFEKIEPCGKCFACTSEYTPDLVEVNGSSERGIDDIRNLQSQATLSPQGKYKLFIIDECQGLTAAAWGACNKLLEDTPKETIIILCTTNPERVPDSIIGRCVRLDIQPISKQDCLGLLAYVCAQEELPDTVYNDQLFDAIAEYANGHARNALNALESVRNYVDGKNEVPNIKQLLTDINETVLRAPEWQLALKYLLAVYRGKYTGALRVIEAVENYEGFIKLLLEYHSQVIYWMMSEKLLNKFNYGWIYDELAKHKLPTDMPYVRKMCALSEALTKTAGDIKSYLVDARFLMIALTVQQASFFGGGTDDATE